MIAASPGNRMGAGVLALLTHVLFIAMLVLGVSWQNQVQAPVYADMWTALPPIPRPTASAPPEPVAKPAPEPDTAPAPVVPPPKKVDIPVEKKPEKVEVKPKPKPKPDDKPKPVEKAKVLEKPKSEKKPEPLHDARVEQAKRQVDEDLARQLRDELGREAARETARMNQQAVAAKAEARDRMIRDYQERIRSKIRGYLRLPPNLVGNPEVAYQVQLMPDGEVFRVVLARASGQPAYDQEVERAILKASPLPLPPEREAAAVFRAGLVLKFRPRDD